ncbi:MAG: amidase, partial [Stellaceae bacterium]
MNLTGLTIGQARDQLRRKAITARELAEAYIKAMEAARPLKAYLVETPDRALAAAKQSDSRLQKGEGLPLDGVPIAVKDLFCTEGVETTAASKILAGFVPPYESTVTANLWRNGALMLGKVNLDEFAMGSATITSARGPTENPWRRRGDNRPLVPGGSSGGSA